MNPHAEMPPPEDTGEGWRPDPRTPGQLRWWDGQQWSQKIKMPEGQKPPGSWSRLPTWVKVAIPVGVVLVAVIAALGGGEEDGDQSTSSPAASKPAGGTQSSGESASNNAGGGSSAPPKPVPSGVEGVPVPEGAKLDKENSSGNDETWLITNMTYDELKSWYEAEMPEGQDFKGWTWCDTGGGYGGHAHIYSRGARDILAVTTVQETVGNNPDAVLIGTDKSGPC